MYQRITTIFRWSDEEPRNDQLEEQNFYGAVYAVQQQMEQDSIPCSVGVSWRSDPSSMKEQLEEADRRMYEEKRRYYSFWEHDRRNRRD